MRTLPRDLKRTVYNAVLQFGFVLKKDLGAKKFNRIESIRKKMRLTRSSNLSDLYTKLHKLSSEEQFEIAHAFSFMLELINTCENAYRTYRLRQKDVQSQMGGKDPIIHVLTAHPTEARSSILIFCFQIIQSHLIESFEKGTSIHSDYFKSLLLRAWQTSMILNEKPTVADEAEHLFSIVLRKEILETFLEFNQKGPPVFLRSWVGGDKDGHPGVDEKTLVHSLEQSRFRIIDYLRSLLEEEKKVIYSFGLESTFSRLEKIKKIKDKDAVELTKLKEEVLKLPLKAKTRAKIISLFELFPGLVIPLELRESAEIIQESIRNKNTAISRMLRQLGRISGDLPPYWYARGLILSMTETSDDLIQGLHLVKREMGNTLLPVIPLLEKESAIRNGVKIVEGVLKSQIGKQTIRSHWFRKYEIMLGYSDSAKESGSIASRTMVSQAVKKLDRFLSSHKIQPVFFHGSGGSVARGGGSITEQTEWWPKSALDIFKTTVQGEMVQRNFSSPEIFISQTLKVVKRRQSRKKHYGTLAERKLSDDFVELVKTEYQKKVQSSDFMRVIEFATPYRYLSELKIGSRPSKRKKGVKLEHLRAIPWVLCWTQTRVLFPVWWGIGTSWNHLSQKEKKDLAQYYRKNPLYSSFVKQLSFTLAKVELSVWNLYLEKSPLSDEEKEHFKKIFKKEFKSTIEFVKEISGEKKLIWFRPWLEESIFLRSPMIHPLNVLQLIAIEKNDLVLLRQTVTGIACGMLSTG